MTIPRNTERVGTAPSTQAPVSVVVPAFNDENHLRELIESNQAQSHRNLEIIVTKDDGSDASRDIVIIFLHPHLPHG